MVSAVTTMAYFKYDLEVGNCLLVFMLAAVGVNCTLSSSHHARHTGKAPEFVLSTVFFCICSLQWRHWRQWILT